MSALAATLLLALAAGDPPVPVNVPAPGATAAEAPAATPRPPALELPRAGGPGLGAMAAPAVLLAGLGIAALLLLRRRVRPGRLVQVLETTALGPKRSLVLARLGDEVLLLGASEAGITLLRSQAADSVNVPVPEPAPEKPARLRPAARPEPPALAGLVARLRGARPAAERNFDALLTESAEDQELRRKLARGQAGSVR